MGSYSDANGDKKEIIVTSPKDERASLVNFDRYLSTTAKAQLSQSVRLRTWYWKVHHYL
jgi:hypothetical protein